MTLLRWMAVVFASLLAVSASAQTERTAIFQPEPRPMPASAQFEAGLQLEYYFTSLTQGGLGLLRLAGADIARAQFQFRGETSSFFFAGDGAWHALVTADMSSQPRAYPLTVTVERGAEDVIFERQLRITAGDFIRQNLALPAGRIHLLDPAIENEELARLNALTAAVSPAPLWDASGFELPHESELTTPFGAVRALNDGRESRHTGWDQNLPIGSPVRALAAGEVKFAGALDIRGNYALIDHGRGLYSGYAHFSQLHVEAGQRVAAGQIIGLSGNTGRSSAPHLHWEIAIRGRWVDGAAFLDLWLPAPGRENTYANIGR